MTNQFLSTLKQFVLGPWSLRRGFLLLLLALTLHGARAVETAPECLWAQKSGGLNADRGQALALDSQGSVFITGFFSGTIGFGGTNLAGTGAEDVFLAKYDSTGTLLWARKAGGFGYNEGRAVGVDSAGNVYLTGIFQGTALFNSVSLTSSGQSDVFLAKYNPSGDLLWVRKAGGNDYDEANGLALDAANNIYLAGSFDATATFGSLTLTNRSSSTDLFVAKCDSAGNFLWARKAGGNGTDVANAIALDAAANVYVAGSFSGAAVFPNTNLTSRGANGLADAFVARYDSAGNLRWVVQGGGDDEDVANAMAVDNHGNVFVTGYFVSAAVFGATNLLGNGIDVFVAKYNSEGVLFWVRKGGGNNVIYGDGGCGIAVDAAGNAWVTGFFSGLASFSSTNVNTSGFDDLFVAKYDSAGQLLWVEKAGGTGIDIGYAIAVKGTNPVYVAGSFSGAALFGATNLTSSGVDDIFLFKLGYVSPPPLSIAKSQQYVLLSWPVAASGFVLESNDGVSSTNWSRVLANIAVVGQSNVTTLPISSRPQFYRLKK